MKRGHVVPCPIRLGLFLPARNSPRGLEKDSNIWVVVSLERISFRSKTLK